MIAWGSSMCEDWGSSMCEGWGSSMCEGWGSSMCEGSLMRAEAAVLYQFIILFMRTGTWFMRDWGPGFMMDKDSGVTVFYE